MTVGAVVGEACEDPIAVTGRTGRRHVGTGERELRMIESGTGPGRRFVAAIATLCPALRNVVGLCGAGQILLMACFATHRCAGKVAHLSAGMATETGDCRVRPDQWKPSSVVQDDLPFGNPVAFVVTLDALRAKLTTMLIFVAADTTSFCKNRNRPAIVVAT